MSEQEKRTCLQEALKRLVDTGAANEQGSGQGEKRAKRAASSSLTHAHPLPSTGASSVRGPVQSFLDSAVPSYEPPYKWPRLSAKRRMELETIESSSRLEEFLKEAEADSSADNTDTLGKAAATLRIKPSRTDESLNVRAFMLRQLIHVIYLVTFFVTTPPRLRFLCGCNGVIFTILVSDMSPTWPQSDFKMTLKCF
jgi:hypothetical protein